MIKIRPSRPFACFSGTAVFASTCIAMPLFAGQPLETESAHMMKAGALKGEAIYEFQTSPSGVEHALPLVIEYGITDRLEVVVEPVVYTAIVPKSGRHASGFGDTEVTLAYLFSGETDLIPALAVATEVKLPTAKDRLIGTGKADYTGTLIASKRFGNFDIHANFGYTIIGSPAGTNLNNTFNGAIAAEYHVVPTFDLVAEVLAHTSSSNQGDDGADKPASAGATNPEVSGSEAVAMLGGRYYVTPATILGLGINYDNNQALLIRVGITLKF